MKTHLALATLALLLATGCSSDAKVPDTGRYLVDRRQFANTLADRLIELGIAPASARAISTGSYSDTDVEVSGRW